MELYLHNYHSLHYLPIVEESKKCFYNEQFMNYVWFSKQFYPYQQTSDGRQVEIIDVGCPNIHEGPDVFNAKIKIDGLLWAGNVEFHTTATDWYRHHHDNDNGYQSVILHVVLDNDCCVQRSDGSTIDQIVLQYPKELNRTWKMAPKHLPLPCEPYMYLADKSKVAMLFERMMIARLETKSLVILELLNKTTNDWEETFYILLMRAMGFSTNGDAFEALAKSLPFKILGKHKDNIVQLEALLLGQASMITISDDYSKLLKREYDFLSKKFNLTALPAERFKHLRMRPSNFPEIRLVQMADLIHRSDRLFNEIITHKPIDEYLELFSCKVSDYWLTHYRLGVESSKRSKSLSKSSINTLIINVVVPFMFCYAKRRGDDVLLDYSLSLLSSLPAEKNNIVDRFVEMGIEVEHAGCSQALIELHKHYCEKSDCLRCGLGAMTYYKAHQLKDK